MRDGARMIRLENVPVGARFSYRGTVFELVNHDNSGSLSAGPLCKRVSDREDVYLCYIEWGKDPDVSDDEWRAMDHSAKVEVLG